MNHTTSLSTRPRSLPWRLAAAGALRSAPPSSRSEAPIAGAVAAPESAQLPGSRLRGESPAVVDARQHHAHDLARGRQRDRFDELDSALDLAGSPLLAAMGDQGCAGHLGIGPGHDAALRIVERHPPGRQVPSVDFDIRPGLKPHGETELWLPTANRLQMRRHKRLKLNSATHARVTLV